MLACPIPAERLFTAVHSSSSFRVEALHWPLLQCCFSNTVYNLSPSLWRNAKNVCSASPGVATRAGKRVPMVDLIVLTCETQRLKQRLSSVTERLLPDKRCWSQITDVFCLLLTSWYITHLHCYCICGTVAFWTLFSCWISIHTYVVFMLQVEVIVLSVFVFVSLCLIKMFLHWPRAEN